MKIDAGKLNIMIDGQYGSTGKGLLASYIGISNHIDIAISNASANAGHTFYYQNKKHIVKHIPVSGIINDRSTIYLCAGAIINPSILLEEIETHGISPDRICIHPNCAIITDNDIANEKDQMSATLKIASTQSGVGSALTRKISRAAGLAKDHDKLRPFIRHLNLHDYLDRGCTTFMEIPQGLDLSLNSGYYPYVTSRDISVAAGMNDAQVHPHYLGRVAACIRTFPIRVGNIIVDGEGLGYSGPFYSDSIETSWQEIGVTPELTTVTGRVRRVATFSLKQYKNMLNQVRPDYILLNFANYLSTEALRRLLKKLPEVTHLGFGPKHTDIRSISDYV